MDIIRLKPRDLAPFDADFIRIDTLPSGRLCLMGSTGRPFSGIVDLGVHATLMDAEAEGLRWAASKDVKELYVETWQ